MSVEVAVPVADAGDEGGVFEFGGEHLSVAEEVGGVSGEAKWDAEGGRGDHGDGGRDVCHMGVDVGDVLVAEAVGEGKAAEGLHQGVRAFFQRNVRGEQCVDEATEGGDGMSARAEESVGEEALAVDNGGVVGEGFESGVAEVTFGGADGGGEDGGVAR